MTELRKNKIEGDTSGNIAEVTDNKALQVIDKGSDAYGNVIEKPLSQKGYDICIAWDDEMINQAKSFRAELIGLTLDIGERKEILIITPSVPTQIKLVTFIKSLAEAEYNVYLEPTVTDNGTVVPVRSKNPHYQFIGAPESTFEVYEDPTYSASGSVIRTERWGQGTKLGDTNTERDRTILSSDQTLLLTVTSYANNNFINFRLDLIEVEQEDPSFS